MSSPYKNFTEGMKWRQKLAETATYKALDIPEFDGIGVTVNRNQTRTEGMGWRELGVIGAIALVGWMLLKSPADTTPVAPNLPDSEYEVRFFDADGNPIFLDNRSGE